MSFPQRSGFHHRDEVGAYLGATIGEETALTVVEEAARALGTTDVWLTRDQVLAVFEHIAQSPGLVGITARLAKSRFRAKTLATSPKE